MMARVIVISCGEMFSCLFERVGERTLIKTAKGLKVHNGEKIILKEADDKPQKIALIKEIRGDLALIEIFDMTTDQLLLEMFNPKPWACIATKYMGNWVNSFIHFSESFLWH